MKLLLALGLHAGMLWLLGRWLWAQARQPLGQWLWVGLAAKAVTTLVSVLHLTGDAAYFQFWSGKMLAQAWAEPGTWLRMLGQDSFHFGGHALVFHGFSNTFFLLKSLSVLGLATGGNVWLNAAWLSVFYVVGSWHLIRAVRQVFPAAQAGAGVVAFLLWPSVVYWSSGLTKESVLIGGSAWLTALVLETLYGPPPPRPLGRWVLMLLLTGLVFKMRFFFAAFLLVGLAVLGLIVLGRRLGLPSGRGVQVALLLTLCTLGLRAAAEVSPTFRENKFTSQLIRNYADLLAVSRHRPHLEYPDLKPTLTSVAKHAPWAIGNTLVRPWLGESGQWKYVGAGLENLLLVVLLAGAGWAVVRRQAGQLPFSVVLVLGFYCLMVALLVGLTTPNLGTLNRYRTAFLPFLLLLALQAPHWWAWLPGRRFFQRPRP